jgi:hypothetical protein
MFQSHKQHQKQQEQHQPHQKKLVALFIIDAYVVVHEDAMWLWGNE